MNQTTPSAYVNPRALAIIGAVCEHYGVPAHTFYGRCRRATIAHTRHVAMYLLYNLTIYSYEEIGDLCGGRDHTTVMYACHKIAADRLLSGVLAAELSHFRKMFAVSGECLTERVRLIPDSPSIERKVGALRRRAARREQLVGRPVDIGYQLASSGDNSSGISVNSSGELRENSMGTDNSASAPDTQPPRSAHGEPAIRMSA